MKNICIVGLGYVGLPLALQAASKGFKVIGVDKNSRIVSLCSQGKSHITDDFITGLLPQQSFTAQESAPKDQDAYIICVPTPVNEEKEPDLSYVIAAAKESVTAAKKGSLIVVESTINPGVCEEVVLPIIQVSGKELLLAHCPERINPGDKKWNVSNIPRVIGGIDKESTKKAAELYKKIIDAKITELSQIRAAEATKILENTFRDVNIAFVNEMAQSFYKLGIDVKEVIKGASTKPFSFMPHYPGLGVGGHCIAVDPYYMIKKGKEVGFEHNFLLRARKINNSMPRYVANTVQNGLNFLGKPVNGTRITVLGLAYKPGVADDRESPSYDLINVLKARKADLTLYDPFLPEKSTVHSLNDAIKNAECVIIATAHNIFIDEKLYERIPFVVDARNCLDKQKISKKVMYRGVGVGRAHESMPQYIE
jgi:nucleotide sugar dehydrogenase